MPFCSYPLWAFSNGRIMAITRGSTELGAAKYVCRPPSIGGVFSRGESVWGCALPLNAPEIYSRNHAPGWKERKPVYEGGAIDG